MLTQTVKTQIIKVDGKTFNVVPVVLDKKGYKQAEPKDSQSSKHYGSKNSKEASKAHGKDDDEDVGWINVDDTGVAHQEVLKEETEVNKEPEVEEIEFAVDEKTSKKTGTPTERFTHFFSIPLNIKSYHEQLKKLRLEIYKFYDDSFEEYIERTEKAHITLLMLNLDTDDKVKKLLTLKDQVQNEIKKHIHTNQLSIQFGELGIFEKYNKKMGEKLARVLYASIRDYQTIKELTHSIVTLMIKNGILSENDLSHLKFNKLTNKYELTNPHATIIKIPDEKLKDDDLRMVWTRVKKFSFNEVVVSNIDVSTRGEFGDDGFYKPLHRFSFEK